MSKAFTPNMVRSLRPRVQELVDGLLAAMADAGEADLIRDLAFPLPFAVISELLGMPDSDRGQLRDWSHTMTATLDPIVTVEQVRAAIEASDHMLEHILAAIAWKRDHPADDLLSALIAAEDDGDVLSEEELLDQIVLLYIAGHETTVNLIGNGTYALLRNRAQLERWQADPGLDTNAVEELLRYDSPVQFSRRIAVADMEIAGHPIAKGSYLMTCLGSANRDEAHWGADAAELDLTRAGAAQHVSFGSGVHHCLGATLARVEAQVAMGSLIRRFPRPRARRRHARLERPYHPPWPRFTAVEARRLSGAATVGRRHAALGGRTAGTHRGPHVHAPAAQLHELRGHGRARRPARGPRGSRRRQRDRAHRRCARLLRGPRRPRRPGAPRAR